VDNRGFVVRFPTREDIFLFSVVFAPTVGPTQPLSHWVPQALSSGLSSWGVKVTIRLHPLPSLLLIPRQI